MLLHEVVVSPQAQLGALSQLTLHRLRREYVPVPAVWIDSIGQPRDIPNEFKARNEIAAGWVSLLPSIGISKNAEWVNYIYYNQQRFINYTDDALSALGEQLDATTKMTWQNRQALDWLLAERGGVCVMFGEHCCTFIPNNTSPEGSFTKAMEKTEESKERSLGKCGVRSSLFWLVGRYVGCMWGLVRQDWDCCGHRADYCYCYRLKIQPRKSVRAQSSKRVLLQLSMFHKNTWEENRKAPKHGYSLHILLSYNRRHTSLYCLNKRSDII